MALLDIKGLKKTYISKYSKEEIQALKDINFSVSSIQKIRKFLKI